LKLRRYTFHKALFPILRYSIGQIIKLSYGFKFKRYKGPNKPTLIFSNHNTNLDPALIGIAFSRHIYFLASEHAFRVGFASKLLSFCFAPIPFNKARTDVNSIKEVLRRIKAGASVCLFPEGDRSFNGQTCPIAISTAKLVKASGADLITYRLECAYFVAPRWAENKRKGNIYGTVVNNYTADELKTMTADDVLAAIERDLFEDAYQRQISSPQQYTGKNLAESIETVLYLCPVCRKFGKIKSKGNRFYCSCGLEGMYTEEGFLKGDSLQFSTITKWDHWQTGQLPDIIKAAGDDTICTDENQQLFEINPAVSKTLIGEGVMRINRTTFHCAGHDFPLSNVTRFTVVGQKELMFAMIDGPTYEVRSNTPRSALKYREIYRVLTGEEK